MSSWKTQHVVLLAAVATVASVALTIFIQSKINEAISKKAAALTSSARSSQKPVNPLEMMSALSGNKNYHQDMAPSSSSPRVRFEEPASPATKREKPSGAGTRWTPL
jgi:hypothetical protein